MLGYHKYQEFIIFYYKLLNGIDITYIGTLKTIHGFTVTALSNCMHAYQKHINHSVRACVIFAYKALTKYVTIKN